MSPLANPVLLIAILVASAAFAATAVLRVLRLIRFFQLEEYQSGRFARWIIRTHNEITFVILCVVAVLLSLTVFVTEMWSIIGIAGLAVLILAVRPTDKQVNQAFKPTPRARRLRVTALIVSLLPLIIGLAIGFASQSVGSLIIGGAVTALVSNFALPIANLVNLPIEARDRAYYLNMARANLDRSGATVIALTGSFGKTSTKVYLHKILSAYKPTLATPRSFNTLMGICRAVNDLLAKTDRCDYFIVEAGAYIPGEIRRICDLVKPQISIVTTVGPMHLERFKTIENIVKAKYEIIEALPPDGIGIFNGDNEYTRGMAERGYPNNRIIVTQYDQPNARFAATDVEMIATGTRFTVHDNDAGESVPMSTPIFGSYNVNNILSAIAAARSVGMPLADIAEQVAQLEPAEHRLVRHILPNGVILIDDAYSANPQGTQMALEVLKLQESPTRIVLSAGMFELGDLHDSENEKLGERIAAVATHAILIGKEQTRPVQRGLQRAGFPPDRMIVVDTLNEAIDAYQPLLNPGDTLLLLTDLPDIYAR